MLAALAAGTAVSATIGSLAQLAGDVIDAGELAEGLAHLVARRLHRRARPRPAGARLVPAARRASGGASGRVEARRAAGRADRRLSELATRTARAARLPRVPGADLGGAALRPAGRDARGGDRRRLRGLEHAHYIGPFVFALDHPQRAQHPALHRGGRADDVLPRGGRRRARGVRRGPARVARPARRGVATPSAGGSCATCTTAPSSGSRRSSSTSASRRGRRRRRRRPRALIERAGGELSLAIEELRELAHGLPPGAADQARAWRARSAASPAARPCRSRCVALPAARLDDTAEATAYYVIAEAVTNAQRYAARVLDRVAAVVGHRVLDVERRRRRRRRRERADELGPAGPARPRRGDRRDVRAREPARSGDARRRRDPRDDGVARTHTHRVMPAHPAGPESRRSERPAARRPDRRTHRLGGARPRGARLRDDRRRLAGRRPLRRARRAAPLRRARQLAAPRRRARWRRPRRCRPRRSATSSRGRHRRASPRSPIALALVRRASLALVAGLLRLGFLAELHLRAGAQGLHRRARADDHRRPGAEAVRRRQGRRATSSSSSADLLGNLGDTSGATLLVGALLARARARAAAGRAGRARARWSPSRSGSPRSSSSTSTTTASTSSGTIDSGLPSFGLPDVAAARTTATLAPGGDRRDAGRLRRGPRRGQDLRGARPLRDRRRTAS